MAFTERPKPRKPRRTRFDDEALNADLVRAIDYLMALGLSEVAIDRAVGYVDGMTERVRNQGACYSGERLRAFVRFASSRGYDALASTFFAPGKAAVEELPQDHIYDGDVRDELLEAMEGLGNVNPAVELGDINSARRHVLTTHRASLLALGELDRMAMRRSRFDGSRSDSLRMVAEPQARYSNDNQRPAQPRPHRPGTPGDVTSPLT